MMTHDAALHKSERLFEQLKELVDQAVDQQDRVDQVERNLFVMLLELGHCLLTMFLAKSGDGDEGKQVEHQGQRLVRLPKRKRRYVSIFGALDISRYVYAPRKKQKACYTPLDARLGLPAGEISYVLEDWLERMCVKDSFRDSVTSLGELLGNRVKVSVDTAEEHCRQMAEHVASFRASQLPPSPDEEGELLVATADGKGVPMCRSPDQAEGTSRSHRRGKGEKANKKQMSYVGAVYTIDPFVRTTDQIVDEVLRKERAKDRPQPQHKHLRVEMTRPRDKEGTRLLHGPSYLFTELAVECLCRDPDTQKTWICLLDGEHQLWDLKQEWLGRAIGILDFFHVTEKLWTAAYCFHQEGSDAAKHWVEKYMRQLLDGKVDSVIHSLRQLMSTRGLKGTKRRRLQSVITYYNNNRQHMKYDEYLAAGYPIGTGVAEGACRHLVKDRMEGSGMRWTLPGALAMLHVRSTYLNGDWNDFVEHRIQHEQAAIYRQAA